MIKSIASALACGVCIVAMATPAQAQVREYRVPAGNLKSALDAYARQSGRQVIYKVDEVRSARSPGVKGNMSAEAALTAILAGSGFKAKGDSSGALAIVRSQETASSSGEASPVSGRARIASSSGDDIDAGGGEITVTAQRREERLQDVPATVIALSGQQLDRAGVVNSKDLAFVSPGVVITNTGTTGTVNIRGVASYLQGIGGDPSTAIYMDGVYQSRAEASLFNFLDVKRVEVLKGPQVVLYGRNAVAGAVSYISNDPTNAFGGHVAGQVGNYNLVRAEGVVNVPLVSDTVLLRAAVLAVRHDGYTKNILNPKDQPGSQNTIAARVTVKIIPSERLDLTLRGSVARERGSLNTFEYTDPVPAWGSAYDLRAKRLVSSNQISSMPQEADQLSATLNWDLDFATLTSITAYSRNAFGPLNYDFDSTELNGFHVGVVGRPSIGLTQSSKAYSQEMYLVGELPGVEWILGGSYFNEKGVYGGADEIGTDVVYFPSRAHAKAWAGYGQVGLKPLDGLRLVGGIRYSWERKAVFRTPSTTSPGPYVFTKSQESWGSLSPSLTAQFDFSRDAMAYLSYSRGFKSGAFNEQDLNPAVNPEKLDNFELGTKFALLDNRLNASLSIFHYIYRDKQININDVFTQTSYYQNAGKSKATGVDISLYAKPTNELTINIGAAWLRARYIEYFDPVTNTDYSGNVPDLSPKFTLAASATYEREISEIGMFRLNGNIYYSSGFMFDPSGNPALSQPRYALVNGKVDLIPRSAQNITLSLFVRNLTNHDVYSYSNGDVFALDAPRTWGVELRANF